MKEELREVVNSKLFVILIDPQLAETNGYLRSLHFLVRLSGNAVKRVVVWEPGRNCNKPLDTSGLSLELLRPSIFSPSDLLHCVFANDEKDEQYLFVHKYIESTVPSIIIVNHERFIPRVWAVTGKPLESKSSFPPHRFEFELNEFLAQNRLVDFRLPETKNLAFTETNALHHAVTSKRARVIDDLFDFEDDQISASPIWDWAIALLRLKQENKVANVPVFLFNALRPLLERNKDVKKVALEFDSFLKTYRYDESLLSKARKKKLQKAIDSWSTALEKTTNIFIRSVLHLQLARLRCL